jgi:hypothetical protein
LKSDKIFKISASPGGYYNKIKISNLDKLSYDYHTLFRDNGFFELMFMFNYILALLAQSIIRTFLTIESML